VPNNCIIRRAGLDGNDGMEVIGSGYARVVYSDGCCKVSESEGSSMEKGVLAYPNVCLERVQLSQRSGQIAVDVGVFVYSDPPLHSDGRSCAGSWPDPR